MPCKSIYSVFLKDSDGDEPDTYVESSIIVTTVSAPEITSVSVRIKQVTKSRFMQICKQGDRPTTINGTLLVHRPIVWYLPILLVCVQIINIDGTCLSAVQPDRGT